MGVLTTKHYEVVKRKVVLDGLKDIVFDRYAGDNNTKLEPWQKLYLQPGESQIIGLPAINIMSLLTSHNTNSAPKRLRDARQFKKIANSILSFVDIGPEFIPFLRDKKPICFGRFEENEIDLLSKCYIRRDVARLDKGIPNPKIRPVLPTPWSLEFDFTFYPNKEIKEQEIINLLQEAGSAIGLGTYRGVFGKFKISEWK